MGMKCKKSVQMKSFRCLKSGQCGQAITEFILGMMILISFSFFFIKMAAVFAIGNYIHYATFMAARSYMSSHDKVATQKESSEQVMKSMIGGRWKGIITASGGGGVVPGVTVGDGPIYQDEPGNFWNQGVSFAFNSKLSLYPWGQKGQSVTLKLVSESWMPREETAEECQAKKEEVKKTADALEVQWDDC
jgi:hypothetical protein